MPYPEARRKYKVLGDCFVYGMLTRKLLRLKSCKVDLKYLGDEERRIKARPPRCFIKYFSIFLGLN